MKYCLSCQDARFSAHQKKYAAGWCKLTLMLRLTQKPLWETRQTMQHVLQLTFWDGKLASSTTSPSRVTRISFLMLSPNPIDFYSIPGQQPEFNDKLEDKNKHTKRRTRTRTTTRKKTRTRTRTRTKNNKNKNKNQNNNKIKQQESTQQQN